MKIYSVMDPEFKPYGQILEGYDTRQLLEAMDRVETVSIVYLKRQVAETFSLDLLRLSWWRDRLFGNDDAISEIFLENLKTATPWVIKEVNIRFLLDQLQ